MGGLERGAWEQRGKTGCHSQAYRQNPATAPVPRGLWPLLGITRWQPLQVPQGPLQAQAPPHPSTPVGACFTVARAPHSSLGVPLTCLCLLTTSYSHPHPSPA